MDIEAISAAKVAQVAAQGAVAVQKGALEQQEVVSAKLIEGIKANPTPAEPGKGALADVTA